MASSIKLQNLKIYKHTPMHIGYESLMNIRSYKIMHFYLVNQWFHEAVRRKQIITLSMIEVEYISISFACTQAILIARLFE